MTTDIHDTPRLGEAKLKLTVLSRRIAADGVVILELGQPDGTDLPEWTPGAHIDIDLPNGLIRQYSLCGSPADRSKWTIGVLRELESRGGSAHIHERLNEGVIVNVIGPRNHFQLETSANYIFIAGGIGITPILPMIEAAEAAGATWKLAYGGRSRSSMAFLEELAAYGGRSRSPTAFLQELAAWGNQVSIQPFDEVGLIDLAALLDQPAPDTLVYACGPEPLLEAIEAKCQSWPHGALHVERFSAKPLEPASFSGTFEVELAGDGRVFTVPPDQSIMEVLEDAGIDILCSCREGVCGSCETPLLAGLADHRDSVLGDDEKARGDRIMICVSRSRSGDRLLLGL